MNIPTLINRIQAYIVEPPNYNKIVDSINIAISRINILTERFDSFIKIINATAGTWGSVTSTWGDTDTDWGDLGKFTDWFNYNSTDYTLSATTGRIMKLDKIYKNGLALREVSVEVVELYIKQSILLVPDTNSVAINGRTIHFLADISSGTDVYKIKCKLALTSIKSTTIEYNIPAYFDDLIYNILIYDLGDKIQKQVALNYIKAELDMAGIKTDIWS